MQLNDAFIKSVVQEVLAAMGTKVAATSASGGQHGVFRTVDEAVDAASKAQALFEKRPIEDRTKALDCIRKICREQCEELGRMEFEETKIGRLDHKIAKLGLIKLVPGVDWLRPDARSGDHGITLEEYTPFGVVGAITPSTHSIPTLSGNIVNIVAAGNAVVLKPGVGGMPAARCLHRLIELAGIDPRLVGILPEAAEAARMAIAARPDKVLFTGSAAVGEKVLFQLAPQLTPATMELSGCDAAIVRADADLDLVVKALKFSLALNDGATCMAPKRVFVSAARATELEGRLAEAMRPTTITLPLSPALKASFDDLLSHGAHFIAGGLVGDQSVRLPAVLGGVSPASKFLHEDVFAPVVALVTVADDHESVLRTNDCPYALGVSIFTQDEAVARELAGRVNAGVVTINDLLLPTADARLPFGGRNRSGFGSTRGAEGGLSAVLKQGAPGLVPMTESDLPAVLAIEQDIYEFPWTQGNFRDSLSLKFSGSQRGFVRVKLTII